MCLAIPGKLLSVEGEDPAFRVGRMDFCGIKKTVNLAFTPDAEPGDFLLVHVGFALTRIDEEEARRLFEYLAQIGALAEEGLAPPNQDGFGTLAEQGLAP
jgi:hydrogenase expression/formation protein HypC